MKLRYGVGEDETKRLVYAKYLIHEGRRYLKNRIVERYFNISIILFANAIELLCQTIAYCKDGKDVSDLSISEVLKSLKGQFKKFPYGQFNKIVRARNQLYHGGVFHTYGSCADFAELTEHAFKALYSDALAVDYSTISLTNLVKNGKIREALRNAETFLSEEKIVDSIIFSCLGLEKLKERVMTRSREVFEYKDPGVLFDTQISWEHVQHLIGRNTNIIDVGADDTDSLLRMFSKHIEEQVNKKVVNILRLIDFELLLGDSYEDYKYFMSNIPSFHLSNGDRISYDEKAFEKRNLTKEDGQLAFDFVLTLTLDLESKFKPINKRNLSQEVRLTVD